MSGATKKNLRIFGALVFRGHPFLRLQRNVPKNTKENFPSDIFCSHLNQNGQIDLPFSPDCHIFVGITENTHNGHLWCHNGHMAIWPFDVTMALWPYSHMAIMASNVDNMGVAGNSNKNVAIW